jgi:hypothetical protein
MMSKITIARRILAGSAALMLLSAPAMAQMQLFGPGTDCSKVPQSQRTDCDVQQHNTATSPATPGPTLPGNNGTGTNQNGTLTPNGSSGQTNGSTSGTGGGNGGASPPGQYGN